MAAEDSRRVIREIAAIIATATATEHGRRRANGEALPDHERLQLQRRKVTVLRAIANDAPHAHGVAQAAANAESQLAAMLAATRTVPGSSTTAADGLSP